mmetsp:Transcript_17773/g.38616  ORF Transcript_17773/g.38616 Transcript_17773/m.38616 type:complete len:398 (+) Transcript_17773:365-1558(+)
MNATQLSAAEARERELLAEIDRRDATVARLIKEKTLRDRSPPRPVVAQPERDDEEEEERHRLAELAKEEAVENAVEDAMHQAEVQCNTRLAEARRAWELEMEQQRAAALAGATDSALELEHRLEEARQTWEKEQRERDAARDADEANRLKDALAEAERLCEEKCNRCVGEAREEGQAALEGARHAWEQELEEERRKWQEEQDQVSTLQARGGRKGVAPTGRRGSELLHADRVQIPKDIANLSPSQIFKRLDEDMSGMLEYDELVQGLNRLLPTQTQLVEKMVATMFEQDDTAIDLDLFVALCDSQNIWTQSRDTRFLEHQKELIKRLRQAAVHYDLQQSFITHSTDGQMNCNQYMQFVKDIAPTLSRMQLSLLFKSADEDESGTVDFDEFYDMIMTV